MFLNRTDAFVLGADDEVVRGELGAETIYTHVSWDIVAKNFIRFLDAARDAGLRIANGNGGELERAEDRDDLGDDLCGVVVGDAEGKVCLVRCEAAVRFRSDVHRLVVLAVDGVDGVAARSELQILAVPAFNQSIDTRDTASDCGLGAGGEELIREEFRRDVVTHLVHGER